MPATSHTPIAVWQRYRSEETDYHFSFFEVGGRLAHRKLSRTYESLQGRQVERSCHRMLRSRGGSRHTHTHTHTLLLRLPGFVCRLRSFTYLKGYAWRNSKGETKGSSSLARHDHTKARTTSSLFGRFSSTLFLAHDPPCSRALCGNCPAGTRFCGEARETLLLRPILVFLHVQQYVALRPRAIASQYFLSTFLSRAVRVVP